MHIPTDRSEELRRIPSVERVLSAPSASALIARRGREQLKRAVIRHLEDLRAGRASGFTVEEVVMAAQIALDTLPEGSLRTIVNGTGILIHTNMGRSPVSREIWDAAADLVTRYSNLELDAGSAGRGHRDLLIEPVAAELFGSEGAILTNNNASATLLLMAGLAGGREVVVSRGELVEIGGSFRVPEVIEQGGARLREVGTTNRTRTADYLAATGPATAAWLRVHRSNFEIVGFTEEPEIGDLSEAARRSGLPLIYDEGSGRIVDLARYGLASAPTIRQLIAAGVDAVTFSTDKLVGATQGGLIVGSRAVIERCRRHPLMRAVRAGKESYAIVAATLRSFLEERYEREIPLYAMLSMSDALLRERADRLADAVAGCTVVPMRSAAGGGTTPGETIPSWGVAAGGPAEETSRRCLRFDPPVIGVIQEDQFRIDLRTVLPEQDGVVESALSGD